MPVESWIDDAERIRYIAFSGFLTRADVEASYQMIADPNGEPTMDVIVDTTAVAEIGGVAGVLRDIALRRAQDAKQRRAAPRRVAIVAPADAVYGTARMYESYRDAAGTSLYLVCRTMEEARQWLGLPRSRET